MYSTLVTKHLDAYNKHLSVGKGTLMGNWWEENELKKATKVARKTVGMHLKVNHKMLFPDEILNRIDVPVAPHDNTQDRILGKLVDETYESLNKEYGRGKNRVHDLPKVGVRRLNQEQKVLFNIIY
jgi:hypothetical protein